MMMLFKLRDCKVIRPMRTVGSILQGMQLVEQK